MGDLTENFSASEFSCHCVDNCDRKDGTLIDKGLVADLQVVRDIRGSGITITSGFRCASFNKMVGGKPDTAHVKGLAVDIACDNSFDRQRLYDLLRPIFNRIGLSGNFIHVDIDETKPQNVTWVY